MVLIRSHTADLEWANAYLFSAPTRFGAVASQVRAFIDTLGPTWAKGGLSNKVASAMTSAQNMHGGMETTIYTLFTAFAHWGTIIVPPGYTDPSIIASGGNPYGASAIMGKVTDEVMAAVRFQARRVVEIAAKVAA